MRPPPKTMDSCVFSCGFAFGRLCTTLQNPTACGWQAATTADFVGTTAGGNPAEAAHHRLGEGGLGRAPPSVRWRRNAHRRQECRRSVGGATLLSPVLHRSSTASFRLSQIHAIGGHHETHKKHEKKTFGRETDVSNLSPFRDPIADSHSIPTSSFGVFRVFRG